MSDDRAVAEQQSLQGQRDRELFERRLQTNLDLGRAVSFKPTYSPALGTWNLLLAILGAAIFAVIVAINLYF